MSALLTPDHPDFARHLEQARAGSEADPTKLLERPGHVQDTAEHRRKLVKIRRIEHAWKHLESLDLIYLLGGARQAGVNHILGPRGKGTAWTDCSGAQCYTLAVGGLQLRNPIGWTGTLVQEGRAGTSPYLTLLLKEPEQTEGHVIARLRHHPHMHGSDAAEWRWVECGGSDNPHPGGGPTYWRPTEERIAEFPYHRHFHVL